MKMSLALLVVLLSVISAREASAGGFELISLQGIGLKENEFIAGFKIRTSGVYTVAICHIPGGWQMRGGYIDAIDGELSGDGSLGVSMLDRKHLYELTDIYLAEVQDYHPNEIKNDFGGETPASFAGSVTIGTYGDKVELYEVPLKALNFAHVAAQHCPAPHR
jgi:hypothetical protein